MKLHLVVMSGWEPGLQKVSLTKLIQEARGVNLAEAKRCTNEVLAGRLVTLTFFTEIEADSFCSKTSLLGVSSRRETR